jgi:hypothetical protein
MDNKTETDQRLRRRTIISFMVFFTLIIAGYVGWRMLYTEPMDNDVQRDIRKGLRANESIFDKIFSKHHLAKTYPESAAVKTVRVNGDLGMGNDFDATSWKLRVVRKPGDTLFLTLDDIKDRCHL